MFKPLFLLTALLTVSHAFTSPAIVTKSCASASTSLHAIEKSGASAIDSFVDDIKVRIRIAQESNAAGADFKQTVANVVAGEYDTSEVKANVEELINSAPCVMFTWEKSPSCVKAVEAFDMMNVDYKIVRLDDPWSKGNPIRAELGKRVGRTSVPFVFIDGKYVGGYDGGLDGDASAPGMVKMAFQGTLRSSLEKVGALK